MLEVEICPYCFENIAKKNPHAARIWLKLCDNAESIFLSLQENKLVGFLEKRGFVVTTECDPVNAYVSLLGLDLYNEVICINPDKHW